ncbi:hypothetical protein BDN70DRAFT_933321 [Pholiota conissans]|uniref:Rad21/Rec8-like protein N-terminal domain-containing protein n=1 Tax=Pholiota conissans TaxID=109636 RepID=A0A9P5Z0N5_9AGAR|nr:hypothetical protein BDN70DRAFT_933321 [Pholiota conissans]
MFFTPELLAKRDSGFGLLWLAATLGSRSAFKKLPKRSVLTADITQLCDQIAEPAEPLALRLSSNLMFGVVRVYKVKQDIFLNDVTNCVTSLKKVVQDLHISGQDNQLQMPNPVVRPSAVTLVANPMSAYMLDFDALVGDWDKYLNIEFGAALEDEPTFGDMNDDTLDPSRGKKKKLTQKAAPQVETPRKEVHTLQEHHEHLFSVSFDASLTNAGRVNVSSSQAEGDFDNFFAFSDGLDLVDALGLGDDLARELGWAASPAKTMQSTRKPNSKADPEMASDTDFHAGHHANTDIDFNFDAENLEMAAPHEAVIGNDQGFQTPRKQHKSYEVTGPSHGLNPSTFFSRQLLSQDVQSFNYVVADELNGPKREERRLPKRTRLLLDARTELTDDELRMARAKYLESQNLIRQDIFMKKVEKENGKKIEELIWGVPKGIQAESLIFFWQQNIKIQIEARSGIIHLHKEDREEHNHKRRKLGRNGENDLYQEEFGGRAINWSSGMFVDNGFNRQSSEEPGQARRISRSASVFDSRNFAFDQGTRDAVSVSRRSSFFPWDHAGPSSSTDNAAAFPLVEDDQILAPVEIRLRSNSLNHRGSPLASSQRGSMLPAVAGSAFSPATLDRNSHVFGEDFVFNVDTAPIPEETQGDTQKSDLNLITLERHSFNFLEYTKMQLQSLSTSTNLTFETVIPRMTSTRHVAAAAFYHCLVLATKDLLHLQQAEPYNPVVITIVKLTE